MPLLEVCVDNMVSAINAKAGGAQRIELCSSLAEGGLTPSPGFLKRVKAVLGQDFVIFPLIRPRGGDFLYSKDEIEIMCDDIRILKEQGADGFVFGCLDEHGNVNGPVCKRIVEAIDQDTSVKKIQKTFHRAFDMTRDPIQALYDLIDLGFDRILTSGQEKTAALGAQLIRDLVDKSKSKISIMAGGGINSSNVAKIIEDSQVQEFHASARQTLESPMKFRNDKSTMGSTSSEYSIQVTSTKEVRTLLERAFQG